MTAASVPDQLAPGASLSLQLGTGGRALADAILDLQRFLEQRNTAERLAFRTLLVFEELVTNVLRYAHPAGGPRSIDASIAATAAGVELVVEDDGVPFNPLEQKPPPRPASLIDAPVGGLGLTLVRRSTSALRYERAGSINRVVAHIAG